MIVKIFDEFDLEKTANSGQCFRAKKVGDYYRFITSTHCIYIKKVGDGEFEISCDKKTWEEVWYNYFDLSFPYTKTREQYYGINAFTDHALDAGKGLRILHQEPFEVLLSFIISQRKSIPAISSSIEKICNKWGDKCECKKEDLCCFPTPRALLDISESELDSCSLGYRTPYILSAINAINSNKIDLKRFEDFSNEDLILSLMTLKGVGIKVASCVALFAYGRKSIAPIDVWIKRVIENEFDGKSPFEGFGEYAGLVQQYMFYYMRKISKEQ